MGFQYTVLPFGCPWLHARLRSAYICPPSLRQKGIRNTLQPPRMPGAQGERCQECTVPQPTSFIPGNSVRLMRAMVTTGHAVVQQQLAASFKAGASHLLKTFQKLLVFMAAASPVLRVGLLQMRPLQYWMKPRVPMRGITDTCLLG